MSNVGLRIDSDAVVVGGGGGGVIATFCAL